MCRGYHRRQQRRESQQLDAWRRTRLLATILVNIHREAGTAAIEPEELLALPGDGADAAPGMSPEEVEILWAKLDELDADIM